MTSKICFKNSLLFLVVVFITSCKILYPSQETSFFIKVNNTYKADSSIVFFCKPYKDSLDKIMKVPVAELSEDLTKQLPESSLGNMMADILKIKAEEYTGNKIDVAILNYGGIRMSSLTKGKLIIEQAYLLMPFDNYIVEQVLTGQQLSDFCDSIAVKKGWPVAGISFQIKDNKAINIQVNNEPISINRKYNIALSDYLANGGDGLAFLKPISQIQTGKLYRNAIIEYWQQQSGIGKTITSKIENRITYAK